jgi:UDP-N-acetylmuramoyl-L-alanyl-D-glutamate--2,6-diaminopimelate ligase
LSITLDQILAVLNQSGIPADYRLPGSLAEAAVEIEGVTHDSRQVQPGWMFTAMSGEQSDGHNFISDALSKGANSLLVERIPTDYEDKASWIQVPDVRKALGKIAAALYGNPTNELTLVGITGTNGKTTLTFLLEAIFRAAGHITGVVGTINYRWGSKESTAMHTTPEATDLQRLFRSMIDDSVTHALLEVSSHGLHRRRLDGCRFDVGVFTNLSQDHLDYHGDIENYFLAKQILFREILPASGKRAPKAVINVDDVFGRRLRDEIGSLKVIAFGTSPDADVRPGEISLQADGISGDIETPSSRIEVKSGLAGGFNLMNILAAVAVSHSLGISSEAVQKGLAQVNAVPGRLERIPAKVGTIFVDYAHTPDALKTVLFTVNSFRQDWSGRVITVMGCGGDRDKTKRPIMGAEAAALSDIVVVTSDNPRTEDPMAIIDQVTEGVQAQGLKRRSENGESRPDSKFFVVIPDRRHAISWAVENLRGDDFLVIAGKGHETYQEIQGVRHHFDDREAVREELRSRSLAVDPTADCAESGNRPNNHSVESGRNWR